MWTFLATVSVMIAVHGKNSDEDQAVPQRADHEIANILSEHVVDLRSHKLRETESGLFSGHRFIENPPHRNLDGKSCNCNSFVRRSEVVCVKECGSGCLGPESQGQELPVFGGQEF